MDSKKDKRARCLLWTSRNSCYWISLFCQQQYDSVTWCKYSSTSKRYITLHFKALRKSIKILHVFEIFFFLYFVVLVYIKSKNNSGRAFVINLTTDKKCSFYPQQTFRVGPLTSPGFLIKSYVTYRFVAWFRR